MRALAVVLGLLAAAVVVGVVLVPRPSSACSPCRVAEFGEQWTLVPEESTVDGVAVALPALDAGFFVANTFYEYAAGGTVIYDGKLQARLGSPDGGTALFTFERAP